MPTPPLLSRDRGRAALRPTLYFPCERLVIRMGESSLYWLLSKLTTARSAGMETPCFSRWPTRRLAIDAMNMGMGLLPDDRKAEGIIADLSVRENIILAMQAKRGMFKQLSRAKQEEIADKYIDLLQIKTATRETPIRQLSGGNQQKAILARWLATDPDFLILDEPTRGIDVGTKTEIQKLIIQLAGEGKSIMFISSEIEEMLRTCNRLAVLRDGAKVGELDGELTQERVMAAIAGGASNE